VAAAELGSLCRHLVLRRGERKVVTDSVDTTGGHSAKRSVPIWATEPLEAFVEDQKRLEQVMHLAMRGISVICAMPQALAALAKAQPERYDGDEAERRKRETDNLARLAQQEVESGHPLLHAQSAVWLWGALELLIRDLLVRWLQNQPDALQRDPLRRLRVRLGEYESLAREDRPSYLLDLLEQEVAAGLKPGVGRFETLLDIFGLAGAVPDFVRRHLFELSQVRNVLVHRRGIADRRLVEQCPWLQLQIGDCVVVRNEQMGRYITAAFAYAMTILQRLRCVFGKEEDPNIREMIDQWESQLSGSGHP
jgi:hypothetical protein